MRRDWKSAGTILVTFLFALALAACGGGGGSDDGSAVPSGYTGVQTQAVLEPTTAQEVILDAYEGGSFGAGMPVVPLAAGGEAAQPVPLALGDALGTAVKSMDLFGVRPAATESASEPGNCGGEMSYTVNANESTGSFNGSMNFTSYCADGVTMNGGVSFSGSFNQSTQVMQITMNLSSLSTSVEGETITVSGSMSMSMDMDSPAPGSMAMKLVLADQASGKTFYLDYAFTLAEGADYDDLRVTGRFYSHDHGFVDIATVEAVRTYWMDGFPSSGSLRFTGAAGTSATMTFTGGGAYLITLNDGTTIEGTLL